MSQYRFYLKEWFHVMSRNRKKRIKEEYMKLYKIRFSNQFYSELGYRNMSAEKLHFFSKAFGCSLDDLLKPPAEPIITPMHQDYNRINFDVMNA